jgi:hypothetical protein
LERQYPEELDHVEDGLLDKNTPKGNEKSGFFFLKWLTSLTSLHHMARLG